jgi:hypothetical protein
VKRCVCKETRKYCIKKVTYYIFYYGLLSSRIKMYVHQSNTLEYSFPCFSLFFFAVVCRLHLVNMFMTNIKEQMQIFRR